MRFTGTVLAVLVANILTIALLTGAYVYLRSDHGQMLLYDLGLHSIYFSLVASTHDSEIEGNSSSSFVQPRISDMKPMKVEPRRPSQPQVSSSPSTGASTSSSVRKNQSAINSSLKMCRFWNAEYKKDGSSQSQVYRNSACKRYERLSGRDSSNVVALASSQMAKPTYQEQRQREEQEKQARREAKEKREYELYCDRVRERIDHYDTLLRAGGKAHYVNRLRGERKEISLEYSRKCLLGQ
ncbi:hypothetical protein [Marinobacter sp. SS13-12]|uniref:hypothetical protein n=1 Tax=Marinobacter sp. SS13-12 TaxID=3050451 RepID=UPI0025574CAE|nr:hypothetical protein [Marinobacter sp. SS13-12]MDK8463081.1 hypothetical protein [Marinobacter sp. SS13-12]